MRVRYTGDRPEMLFDQGTDALKVGRDYTVLEVSTLSGRESFFRIEIVPDEPPGLYDVRLFEVTSDAIPSHWVISLGGDGLLTIGPREWRKQDFWEAFLDREDWALSAYRSERGKV